MPYGIRDNTIIGKNIKQEADLHTIEDDKDEYSTIIGGGRVGLTILDPTIKAQFSSPPQRTDAWYYDWGDEAPLQDGDWIKDRIKESDWISFIVTNLGTGESKRFIFPSCDNDTMYTNCFFFGSNNFKLWPVPTGMNTIYEFFRFIGYTGRFRQYDPETEEFLAHFNIHSWRDLHVTPDIIRGIDIQYPYAICIDPINTDDFTISGIITSGVGGIEANHFPVDEITVNIIDDKITAEVVDTYTGVIDNDVYLGAPMSDEGNEHEWMKGASQLSEGEITSDTRNKPVRNDVAYDAIFNGEEDLKTESDTILDAINELYDKLIVLEINSHDLDD